VVGGSVAYSRRVDAVGAGVEQRIVSRRSRFCRSFHWSLLPFGIDL